MLPLIPAFLLLLLHGPALRQEVVLPAKGELVTCSIQTQTSGPDALLAQLFLAKATCAQTSPCRVEPDLPSDAQAQFQAFEAPAGTLSEPHSECRRTRDGPASVA